MIFSRNGSTVSHPFRRMSQDQPASSSARRYVLLAVKLAVSVVLLVVLFSRIDVGAAVGDARGWRRCRGCVVALAVYAVSTLVARLALAPAAQRAARRRSAARRCSGRSWSPPSSTTSCRATSAATSSASATRRAPPSSKTLATTVVLVDRVLGLMALVLRRGARRDRGRAPAPRGGADLAGVAVGRLSRRAPRRRRRRCSRRRASAGCCSR